LFLIGEYPLQVELGANLFVYISLVTCEYHSLLSVFGIFINCIGREDNAIGFAHLSFSFVLSSEQTDLLP